MSFMEDFEHRDFIRNYKKFQEQFDKLYWKRVPNWHLVFKEHEDEKFKPIEQYQGFYYISNYGKVISFKRKLPGVKQPYMLNGFQAITLNHFKTTNLHYIHDLVYICFVGKMKAGHRVVHKDKDIFNNNYRNLLLVNTQEDKDGVNSQAESQLKPTGVRAADHSITPSAEPVEKTKPQKITKPVKKTGPIKAKGIKAKGIKAKGTKRNAKSTKEKSEFDVGVLQFDRAGKFIKEFSSIEKAAKKLNLDPQAILGCLKGEGKTAGLFQWRYSADPNFDDGVFEIAPLPGILENSRVKRSAHRSTTICQYNGDGDFLQEFESVREAAESIGVTPAAIHFSMQKPTRMAGGFRWKRKAADPIE